MNTPSTNADEPRQKLLKVLGDFGSKYHETLKSGGHYGDLVNAATFVEEFITAHYLPKDKVRAAIGEDEPIERENAHIDIEREGKNALRHELRRALGLEEE